MNERDIHGQVGNREKIQWVPAAADRRLSLKTEFAILQLLFLLTRIPSHLENLVVCHPDYYSIVFCILSFPLP